MAKPPSSAIGIDLGRHSLKAVLLQRRGANRFALTHFALREFDQAPEDAEALAAHLRALLQSLGGKAKALGITLSGCDSFVRIIEQPEMPPAMLRNALQLNGASLLNQDCRSMVLDCDVIVSSEPQPPPQPGVVPQRNYLVGGVPRSMVTLLAEASQKAKIPTERLQLNPISLLNAFEFGEAETFNSQAFVLVDIGYRTTTVIVGAARELIMVRSLEFGSQPFLEELIFHGAASYDEVWQYLADEEVLTVENARLALAELVRSISGSIGFVEARRETTIPRIFVSGGMAQVPTILRILTEELQLPCDIWNPLGHCEANVSPQQKQPLANALPLLGAAIGCAAELLQG